MDVITCRNCHLQVRVHGDASFFSVELVLSPEVISFRACEWSAQAPRPVATIEEERQSCVASFQIECFTGITVMFHEDIGSLQ